jgi:hypothetical protein
VSSFGDIWIVSGFASLPDWAIVAVVVGVLAFLLARLRLFPERKATEAPKVTATSAPVLAPQRSREHWSRTSAPERPAVTAIQAQAASHVDAAEHAYNRLLAECAVVMPLPVGPTVQAQRELPSPKRPAAARASIAA